MCVRNTLTARVSRVSKAISSSPSPSTRRARWKTSACSKHRRATFSTERHVAPRRAGALRRVPKTASRSPAKPSKLCTSACKENAEMPRFLLLISLLFVASAQAAQSIDPLVLRALERAQTAQEKGDYSSARQALAQAKAKPDSLEQTLLWRSQAYLAWAEGNNKQALELLEKAVASGKLDEQLIVGERLNLAGLNLLQGRYAKVVSLLGSADQGNEEVLQMLVQAYQGLGQHAKALPLAERYMKANPNAADSWLQFLVAVNAELKRYEAAERWQRQLLLRHPDQAKGWRQLAGLQQLAGAEGKALATLRAAHAKGVVFSESELDNLVL